MNELIRKLKEHLKNSQYKYVDHNSWLGDTETGFFTADTFDIDKLMLEIDDFCEEFEKAKP